MGLECKDEVTMFNEGQIGARNEGWWIEEGSVRPGDFGLCEEGSGMRLKMQCEGIEK